MVKGKKVQVKSSKGSLFNVQKKQKAKLKNKVVRKLFVTNILHCLIDTKQDGRWNVN